MKACIATLALLSVACIDRLRPPEVVTGLSVLAVSTLGASPFLYSSVTQPDGAIVMEPIVLRTLAMDQGGIVSNATLDYGVCLPGPLPAAGPPDCLPPSGKALPTLGSYGVLHLPTDVPSAITDGGNLNPSGVSDGTIYVAVRVRSGGSEAVALKRVSLGNPMDSLAISDFSVDGVSLVDQRVRVSSGLHRFSVTAVDMVLLTFPTSQLTYSWYVTAGGPPAQSTANVVSPPAQSSTFDWIAPDAPGPVTVVVVVRPSDLSGPVAWAVGQVDR